MGQVLRRLVEDMTTEERVERLLRGHNDEDEDVDALLNESEQSPSDVHSAGRAGERPPHSATTVSDDEGHQPPKFPDLAELPPELGLAVLSYLKATDLCLAACVWQGLAQDEILWQGLCKEQWGYTTLYGQFHSAVVSFRRLYLLLDEGTLTFNADALMGMEYFFAKGLVNNEPAEIARFFHSTTALNRRQMRKYLDERRDVLDKLIELQNYEEEFLAEALRKFFFTIEAPPNDERGTQLHTLLEKFSARFCHCNPRLGLGSDTVYILCFSLILLSVDLSSPHVKNKMSKREFIRNVRNAIQRPDDEMAGHLYDNIYLRGHIAPASQV